MSKVFSIWIACSRMCDDQRPKRNASVTRKPAQVAPKPACSSEMPARRSTVTIGHLVEARQELRDAAGGLARGLVRQPAPQVVGRAAGHRRVARRVSLREPPRRAPPVAALAADDVAHREPDRPLAAAGVGIEERVLERQQQAVQVPARGGRRPDQPGGTPFGRIPGGGRGPGLDLGQLERLGGAVGAVADLFLAAADPGPGRGRAASGIARRPRAAAVDVGTSADEGRVERPRERVVGPAIEQCVGAVVGHASRVGGRDAAVVTVRRCGVG